MKMAEEKIEQEFRRQIYLCGGIGKDRMREILEDTIENGAESFVCCECGEKGSFFNGHICIPMEVESKRG